MYIAYSLLGPHFHNRARISEQVMTQLMELPMTRGLNDFRDRAEDLTTWKLALQKGCVVVPILVASGTSPGLLTSSWSRFHVTILGPLDSDREALAEIL